MKSWIIVVALVAVAAASDIVDEDTDLASLQIVNFLNKTNGPIGVLRTSNGAPLEYQEITNLNKNLIQNEFFLEAITHLTNERLPERILHAKGSGAFGHFEVTKDISHICKAKFLNTIGKKTPVSVRFSTILQAKGSADTVRTPRGFAIKFYTEDGNLDLVGLSTEMFFLKNPMIFTTIAHGLKPNPVTNLFDPNTLWDLITGRKELIHTFMLQFADRGITDGYRHMPGFTIHTFEVKNDNGVSHFVRFHILPDAGIKTLNSTEGMRLAGEDPDYAGRDLYNAIAKGNYPSWTISVQILTFNDIKNSTYSHFDTTKVIPLDEYPLHEVGRFTLNKNPLNYHADVEQLAFCPGNLVPGILGSPDKLFQARRLAYRQAHTYRLGANFNKIKINCPVMHEPVWTMLRDGVAPVRTNEGDVPNYLPNTFNGATPFMNKKATRPIDITLSDEVQNLDQVGDLYRSFSQREQETMVENLVASLGGAIPRLQKKAIQFFAEIDQEFSRKVSQALEASK